MVLHYQTDKDAQFALQESYADTFDLAAASTIVAPYQLRDALRVFSENVRTLQVLSSDFFVETEGQLKILSGIKDFSEAQVIEVEGLMPRVDTASFTFSAWVQRNSIDSSGYILRKPLGRGREQSMSCYGWFIGRTNIPQVVFGAHDVGLLDQSLNEEQVTAGGQWEFAAAPQTNHRLQVGPWPCDDVMFMSTTHDLDTSALLLRMMVTLMIVMVPTTTVYGGCGLGTRISLHAPRPKSPCHVRPS
eukprot:2717683-Rhodomonas_salina.1